MSLFTCLPTDSLRHWWLMDMFRQNFFHFEVSVVGFWLAVYLGKIRPNIWCASYWEKLIIVTYASKHSLSREYGYELSVTFHYPDPVFRAEYWIDDDVHLQTMQYGRISKNMLVRSCYIVQTLIERNFTMDHFVWANNLLNVFFAGLWMGIYEKTAQHMGSVICLLDMSFHWCNFGCLGVPHRLPTA